jgi:NADH:ubiquinone oxidoreductase subunit C
MQILINNQSKELVIYNSINESKHINNGFNNRKYNIITPRQDVRQVAAILKLHSLTRLTNAIDISVVDHINDELRFNVNYHFRSIATNNLYSIMT